MEKEIWKEIKGYENIYLVSNLGNILTIKTGKISNGWEHDKLGYRKVRLYKNKTYETIFLHRLVAKTFLENPLNKPCVNHIDNNPKNNKLSNLEFVTHKENMQHSAKQNRMKGSPNLVLNIENGIYYDSVIDAAYTINMKPNTLVCKLVGKNRNNTNFIYV